MANLADVIARADQLKLAIRLLPDPATTAVRILLNVYEADQPRDARLNYSTRLDTDGRPFEECLSEKIEEAIGAILHARRRGAMSVPYSKSG